MEVLASGRTVDDVVRRHEDWFRRYVARFQARMGKEDAYCVDLKLEHSFRVLDEARMIIASLDLTPRLIRLGQLAALYHDVGRFRQYERYRTFSDARSENHGRLGAKVLGEEGVLAEMPAEQARLVYGAVSMHNRADSPRRVLPDTGLLTRIVRDADKLDIYRVMLGHFRGDSPKNDVVALHLREEPGRWSPAVLHSLREGRLAAYSDMVYVNDFKLLLLSWVYDLNFPASFTALLERGRFAELLAMLPGDAEVRDACDQAMAYVMRRLEAGRGPSE